MVVVIYQESSNACLTCSSLTYNKLFWSRMRALLAACLRRARFGTNPTRRCIRYYALHHQDLAKLFNTTSAAERKRCVNTAYARIPTQQIISSRYIPRIGASLGEDQPSQASREPYLPRRKSSEITPCMISSKRRILFFLETKNLLQVFSGVCPKHL